MSNDIPVESLRPRTWDSYIGQEALKERLQIHIQAAKAQHRPVPSILLAGPAGCGKTSMAKLIAQEREWPFTEWLAPTTARPRDIYDLIMSTKGVLFIDEIHRLKPAVQEELLGPLDENPAFIHDGWKEDLIFPLTIVAATTEWDKLIRPLYDRFMIKPPFEPYTDEQMAQIIRGMMAKICPERELTEEHALILGRAAGGRPRQAKALALAARDCPTPGPHLVLKLAGITPEGLTLHHLEYLKVLGKNSKGSAGVKVLAASLGMPENAVVDLEQGLIRLELIEYSPGGRTLRPRGRQYLHSMRAQQQHEELM